MAALDDIMADLAGSLRDRIRRIGDYIEDREKAISELKKTHNENSYDTRCEGIGTQSWGCKECFVRVFGPRPGKRPDPFPHSTSCALIR